MNDKKKEKLKKNLVQADLMNQEDIIVDCIQANYVDKLIGNIGKWKQGWVYFTQERLICPTGILEENIIIPYRNICKIEKCSQGFFPMGIKITYKSIKNQEEKVDKISVYKRKKWMSFMAEQAGITL